MSTPDLVQVLNPRSGHYVVVDRANGTIVRHRATPQEGVPIVEAAREAPAPLPVVLAVLIWQDTRIEVEQDADLPPPSREIVEGKLDVSTIRHYSRNESTDAPGTLVHVKDGLMLYVANPYPQFDAAFLAATGARVVEVS